MSKAFTKEDADVPDDETPLVDELPVGAKNYSTPDGAMALAARIEVLRAQLPGDPKRRRAIEQKLALLQRHHDALEIVDPRSQPIDRVLFGASVTVRSDDDRERTYRIVGIDEANASRGDVSWRSPIARALLNRHVGDVITLSTPAGENEIEIVTINY